MGIESLSDEIWTLRFVEQLVVLDPKLEPALAEPIAVDLCTRPRWRAMSPEGAAQTIFDYGERR